MSKIIFQHSDPWIYMCIPDKKPGATREEIIRNADYINHAIPTNEELNGALNRGLESGLIENQNDKYYLSEKYRNKIKKILDSKNDPFKNWDDLEQFLNNFDE